MYFVFTLPFLDFFNKSFVNFKKKKLGTHTLTRREEERERHTQWDRPGPAFVFIN